MVELNNSNVASKQAPVRDGIGKLTVPRKKLSTAAPARMTMPGLGSGMDTQGMIKKMVAAEEKRVEPVKTRLVETKTQVAAWEQVRKTLDALNQVALPLTKTNTWDVKKVESSNPAVLEAVGTTKAKEGTYPVKVEQLALRHQIASQTFSSKSAQINTGKLSIQVGIEKPFVVEITDQNATVEGLVQAINKAAKGVKATLVNTGGDKKPWQIVLTSEKSGTIGRMTLTNSLKGNFETPNFQAGYKTDQVWEGVKKNEDQADAKRDAKQSSTIIPNLSGTYTGNDSINLKFTVINPGFIGKGKEKIRLRWQDTMKRSGYIDIDASKYEPGTPINVVDGIQVNFSKGAAVAGDSFEVPVKAQESAFFWWKTEQERAPRIGKASSWQQNVDDMKPTITGASKDGDNDSYKIIIEGSGVVGEAKPLLAHITSKNGVDVRLNIGKGYNPEEPIALGNGFKISIPKGILNNNAELTFDTQGDSSMGFWWLYDSDKREGHAVYNQSSWKNNTLQALNRIEQKSNAPIKIVGKYNLFDTRKYTFTALEEGEVSESRSLEMQWEDDKGNKGIIDLGNRYSPGRAIPFAGGLSAAFGQGLILKGDKFNFKVYSTAIQAAQDARIRLGATDTGGGLEITSHTNEFKDTIEGVTLTAKAKSDEIVTVTVKNDAATLKKQIKDFIDYYNETLKFLKELTYYDQEKEAAAPLQGNSDVMYIQNNLSHIVTDLVQGLDTKKNQLFAIGIKFTKQGILSVDDKKLDEALDADLHDVALLFETYGKMDKTNMSFIGATEKTKISGKSGYNIDITQSPEFGEYSTPVLNEPIYFEEGGNNFSLSVNDRKSNTFTIDAGGYTIQSLIKKLQEIFKKDDVLDKSGIKLLERNGKLIFQSRSTGANNKIELAKEDIGDDVISNGTVTIGKNVKGTIDGIDATGFGSVLRGREKTRTEGLRLFVDVNGTYQNTQVDNNINITKGVATKLHEYLDSTLDLKLGSLKLFTDTAKEQTKGYEQQVKKMEEAIGRKKEQWQMKFARMEGKMGQLKSEQKYLTTQISKLK